MDSRHPRILAVVLISFGVLLNTAALVPGAREEMSVAVLFFWLWLAAPYLVGAGILWLGEKPVIALGWSALPVIVDIAVFYSVVINPQGSTAGLAYVFSPLWNLVLFGPIGALVARSTDRRKYNEV